MIKENKVKIYLNNVGKLLYNINYINKINAFVGHSNVTKNQY